MAADNSNLFKKLTDLFRSGPVIKRKVKAVSNTSNSKSSLEVFRKAHSDVYNSTLRAYGSYDRMARYSDFSEMEACIAGDTLIATPDGFFEIQHLANKYKKDEYFVVFSYDHDKKKIVPALAKQARKTTTAESYKITFDSGKTLVATPDHRVMKRDGTYCEVQNLCIGDSMMHFDRKDFSVDENEIKRIYKNQESIVKSLSESLRSDITLAKIVQVCDKYNRVDLDLLKKVFDCSEEILLKKLNDKGIKDFNQLSITYGYVTQEIKSFQSICNKFKKEMSLEDLCDSLNYTSEIVLNLISQFGFCNYNDFCKNFTNNKVVKIEENGVIDLYDMTVEGYKNYSTDSIVVHNTPEISSALDIYAEECVSPDAEGQTLHIYSENRMIKKILSELFYDTLNIDFNLVMWVRNLCKYGDFFLFNDIHPEYGVINAFPIPISEIEREEGFDPVDPGAVRFRWVTQGNRVLENWQVSHFRLLGSDAFLPYGSSVLEGARRVWRQLILIEDAMLVYRVIRSPERRVFYIDVGNIPPENISDYLEQAQTSLKRNAVVDKTTGQVDLRYNPLSVDEDYFLPVRGGDTGTRIDTLAGGSNTTAIEDVEYIQKKLFAALKIPKAYLGYDEDIGAKATLAQEDIRFSRTIQRIQKTIVSELNKLAMIHLYTHGYTEEDVLNFELRLSNPSSIAQQQKLELIRTKFEISSSAPEGYVDREWIRKHILDLNDDEINRIEKGREKDKLRDMELESVQLPDTGEFGEETGGETDDLGSDSDIGGGDSGEEEGGGGLADLFSGEIKSGSLMSEEEIESYDDLIEEDDDRKNEKPKSNKKNKRKKKNFITGNDVGMGPIKPDSIASGFGANNISNIGPISAKDLFDGVMPTSPVIEDHIDRKLSYRMSKDFEKMSSALSIKSNKSGIITEALNNDEEYDIIIPDDFHEEEGE